MASISCSCALHRRPTICYLLASYNDKAASFDYKTMQQHSATHVCPVSITSSIEQPCAAPSRRQLIILSALAAFTFPPTLPYAFADLDVDRIYTDDVDRFNIAIPQEWQVGSGEPNGFKPVTAFYPKEDSSSNGQRTGQKLAETSGVAAKRIDCKASKGIYYINYSLQNPAEARRYLYSAIGMASNVWYNRLYTVTGQFMEDNANKYGSQIQKAVSSFWFL